MNLEITKISKNLYLGPELSESLIQELVDLKIKTVVNLSRKGEFQQNLSPEEEGELLKEKGINYLHFPISMSNMKHKDVDTFLEQTKDIDTPLYVHCLFGQRSAPFAMIYHAINKNLDANEILKKMEKLGIEWAAPSLTRFVESYINKFHEGIAA